MRPRTTAPVAVLALSALALTGCVANSPAAGATAISVGIADDACDVSTATATAGAVTFTATNNGTDVNEFEILADDKLRIVGEKENITPGQTVSLTTHLQPGTYYTACKFQQVGAPVGLAEFTVTGEATAVSADRAALEAQAVTEYLAYVKSQVAELVPAVQALTDAYVAGDDATARSLFAAARVPYERIEPTAESFGDLDPKIDYREVDAVAEDLEWTGFHRIEKDLWAPQPGDLNSDGTDALAGWAPSTPAERQKFADGLNADIADLHDLVTSDDFAVSLGDISNGAIALLDEVAAGKITGEEDWWSGTDLSDFAANVQGAEVAFGAVRALAESQGEKGVELAAKIDAAFGDLQDGLGAYGDLEAGFVDYATLQDAQKKALSDQVNALAEPLSLLTATVLGV